MKNKTKSKSLNYYLFSLVYLLFIVLIFAWLFLDQGLPHWDMGRHLYNVLQYRDAWKELATGQRNIFGVAGLYLYYPPLIYQFALAFFKIFGVSAKAAVAANIVWIFILFFSVYQIAWRIYKNQLIAIAAVIFLGAAPLLIGQAREFQVDLPLTAMVALSIWLILRTDQFSKLLPSLLFGLAVGIGMLTKWTYVFYVLPLIAIYFAYSIISAKKKIPVLLNLIYAALVAIVISGYWYFTNKGSLLTDFNQNGIEVAKQEGDPTGFSVAAMSWYFKRILDNYLFLPLFIIYLAGLVWALIKKEWRQKLLLILILTPIYYLIFSILPNKDTRYLMPLIPLLAIIGVCAFTLSLRDRSSGRGNLSIKIAEPVPSKRGISPRNDKRITKDSFHRKRFERYRMIYQIALLGILIAIFFVNNLNIPFSNNLKWQNNNIYLFHNQYLPLISNNGYTTNSPRAENCPIDEVMASVPEGKTLRLFGPNLIDYNNWMVAFNAGKTQKVWAGESENYLASQYLIYRNQNIIEPNITAELKSSGKIKLINTYDCADGGRVELYKTIPNF